MAGRLNGISLARELRKSNPGIRVLLASGFSSPISAGTDLGEVGADFIAKPYRKADLARVMRAILDRPVGTES
jgi:DNA-binding response OmpR family regulator